MPSSLLKRTSTYLFFMGLLFITLGMPLDTWWTVSVFVLALMIGALAKSHINLKKGLLALVVCGVTFGLKTLLPLSYIEEGANVFVPTEPIFKELPQSIYDHSNKTLKRLYPQLHISPDHQLYAFSVEQFHQKSNLSRKRKTVNFTSLHEARFGFMNKLNYNTSPSMTPKREHLPFFVRYELPQNLAYHKETKICWKGDIFIKNEAGIYTKWSAPQTQCVSTVDEKIKTFYGVSVDPEVPLSLSIEAPFSQRIWIIIEMLLSLFGVLLITNIFYPFKAFIQQLKEEKETRFKGMVLLSSIVFSFIVAFFYRPHFMSGFLLFEGGNDALSYASKARVVLEALFVGDWRTALMGGEAVFDLMPLHRYTYALNLFLFGETHFGYFMLILFAPLSIYYLTKHLFESARWAFALAMIFAVVPAFETFGFTQLYMVRLGLRGFAEPLSYIAFFTAIALGLPYLKQSFLSTSHTRPFLVGLCLAIAVGARPNVAPGAGIFLLCVSYGLFRHLKLKYFLQQVALLCFGFLPILLIPLHNYIFGDVFVLFTVAGQKVENLAVSLQDYGAVLKGLIESNIQQEALKKITSHLLTEIKPTQPWFYLVLLLNFYGLLSKKLSTMGKTIALTGLSQLSIVFFYNIGGRYGYLHWSLLLLTALLVLKNLFAKKGPV